MTRTVTLLNCFGNHFRGVIRNLTNHFSVSRSTTLTLSVVLRTEIHNNYICTYTLHFLNCECNSGEKKQYQRKRFGPDFLRTFLTFTLGCPGVKGLSPSPGPQENTLFSADVHDPKASLKILSCRSLRRFSGSQYQCHAEGGATKGAVSKFSRSETWVPKRGGLKSAGKRQESATFLQRSFFDVAVQFFVCCSAAFGPNDFRTAEKTMLQCSSCSAALRKLQCNFRFRLWHVAGVGFRGVRFRTC